jgi:CrcB protein
VALVIAAGGAVGGGARWLVNQAVPTSPSGFPWSTFAENVTGCFLLAVVMVFLLDVWPPHRYARPFIGIGVLGGYTTFSTYTSDTRVLLDSGQALLALAYLFGSVAVGLLSVVAGLSLTRTLAGVTPPRERKEAS